MKEYTTPSGKRTYWVETTKLKNVYPHAKPEFADLDVYAVMGREGTGAAREVGGEAFQSPERADLAALHLAFGMREERKTTTEFHGMYAQASKFVRHNAIRLSLDVQPHSGPHRKLELLLNDNSSRDNERTVDELVRRINNFDLGTGATADEGKIEAIIDQTLSSLGGVEHSNRVKEALRGMYALGRSVSTENKTR